MKVKDPAFLWLGEHRALDFLNTEPIVRGERVELLDTFERLVAWCVQAELLPAARGSDALSRWGASRAATRALETAHQLRSELRVTLEHRAGRARRAGRLDVLNDCLRLGGETREVVTASRGRFERRVHVELTKPVELLRPIAEAAADLLCTVDLALVRRCNNPECVLYFHDVSKNHARRWCSMAVCGNRMKVAAHHERRRMRSERSRTPMDRPRQA